MGEAHEFTGLPACTRLSFCTSTIRHTGYYLEVESKWSSAQLNMVVFQDKKIAGKILQKVDFELVFACGCGH